jgi:hypothetical protein
VTAPVWDRDALARSPWFASVRNLLERLPAGRFPGADDLNTLARGRGVLSGGGAPLAFVPPAPGPSLAARHYEGRIFRTGEVATRPGSWHDLFNALAWLAFPRTKAVLNRAHTTSSRGWATDRRAARRGRGDALRRRRDRRRVRAPELRTSGRIPVAAPVRERRADVARAMRFLVFGHAILRACAGAVQG